MPVLRVLEFNKPIFGVLMKKRPISNLHLTNLFAMLLATVIVVKLNPGSWASVLACTGKGARATRRHAIGHEMKSSTDLFFRRSLTQ